MPNVCSFCDKVRFSTGDLPSKPWDVILFESENFIVFPTIGAVVEGWLLLVPKSHHLCMATIEGPLWSELIKLQKQVSVTLENVYGAVATFEHGPAKPNQSVGCGVDHAHLHIVPTSCDLTEGLETIFKDSLLWTALTGIQDLEQIYRSTSSSYLYIEQPLGRSRVATHSRLGSQLFRRVLARNAGCELSYDWRQFPNEDKVNATVSRLRSEAK